MKKQKLDMKFSLNMEFDIYNDKRYLLEVIYPFPAIHDICRLLDYRCTLAANIANTMDPEQSDQVQCSLP